MKEIVLDMLKAADGYVSGETISERLGVTRAAVWKAVSALRRQGYAVEAAPNRGYRLASLADVLSGPEIRESLRKAALTSFYPNLVYQESTGSTNQLARLAVETGAPSGSLFAAACQTAGKGRRGRTWQSDHHEGLWFSILLRPRQGDDFQKITLFTSLCVVRALRQDFCIDAGIKWPNDIISQPGGRKICGILTESIFEEQTAIAVIIGIGLNINTCAFPPELAQTATSMFLESGRTSRRIDVLMAVLRQFAALYPSFGQPGEWLDDYRRLCLTIGREVMVLPGGGEPYAGTAIGLDNHGELVVEDESSARHVVLSGEVSIRNMPAAQL